MQNIKSNQSSIIYFITVLGDTIIFQCRNSDEQKFVAAPTHVNYFEIQKFCNSTYEYD
jgi:hypothetical protein